MSSKAKKTTTKLQKRSSIKYDYWTSEEGLQIIEGAILSGEYTIDLICKKLIGISRKTFYSWCKKDKDLDEIRLSTQEKKEFQIDSVLFRCCKGYWEDEEIITKDGLKYTRKVFHPPDPKMMQIYYAQRESAKNRRAAINEGNQKVQVQITIDDGKNQEIIDLDKDLPVDEVLNDDDIY